MTTAVSLAKRARHVLEQPELPETKGIRVIADLAAAQLNDAIKAFCDGDLKLALVLQSRDDALDAAYRAFHQEVIGIMEKDSSHVRNDVDLLFITRFLERIGDQSVNIAEDDGVPDDELRHPPRRRVAAAIIGGGERIFRFHAGTILGKRRDVRHLCGNLFLRLYLSICELSSHS